MKSLKRVISTDDLEQLQTKDDLLFQLLLLLNLTNKGDYSIDKEYEPVVDKAMSFYVHKPVSDDSVRKLKRRVHYKIHQSAPSIFKNVEGAITHENLLAYVCE